MAPVALVSETILHGETMEVLGTPGRIMAGRLPAKIMAGPCWDPHLGLYVGYCLLKISNQYILFRSVK